MSAKDRFNVYEQKCPCSNGTIKIYACTRGHAYEKPWDEWYESDFNCTICSPNYEIEIKMISDRKSIKKEGEVFIVNSQTKQKSLIYKFKDN